MHLVQRLVMMLNTLQYTAQPWLICHKYQLCQSCETLKKAVTTECDYSWITHFHLHYPEPTRRLKGPIQEFWISVMNLSEIYPMLGIPGTIWKHCAKCRWPLDLTHRAIWLEKNSPLEVSQECQAHIGKWPQHYLMDFHWSELRVQVPQSWLKTFLLACQRRGLCFCQIYEDLFRAELNKRNIFVLKIPLSYDENLTQNRSDFSDVSASSYIWEMPHRYVTS